MRRRLGRYDAGGTPADASGLDERGIGLSRFAVPTDEGPAGAELDLPPGDARALVVLGHGAGGGIAAPDLAALATALPLTGFALARVEQPYRVAGRPAPPPASRLDAAWRAVLAQLVTRPELAGLPLVVGGRSSGARVACRTAVDTGASGVVALAFPLRPPGRAVSRQDELLGVTVASLVVQGSRDAFGSPPLPAGMELFEVVAADHSFRARRADGRSTAECLADVAGAVTDWLGQAFGASRPRKR